MNRYRPVETRVWGDKKFVSLSNEGKMLWLFLLTAPSSTPIPGLIIGGHSALAEAIGWDLKTFQKAFSEVLSKGFAVSYDLSSRILWLRNSIRLQPPLNPNIVSCWAKQWADVPECDLKSQIWEDIRGALSGDRLARFLEVFKKPFSEGFKEGFKEGFPEAFGEASVTVTVTVPQGSDGGSAEGGEKPKRRRQPSELPADWKPNAKHEALAKSENKNLDREADRFRDWCAASGRLYANHDAAFSNWLRSEIGSAAPRPAPQKIQSQAHQLREPPRLV